MSREEFLKRVRAKRKADGLPEHVEDEATLRRIAAIVANERKSPTKEPR